MDCGKNIINKTKLRNTDKISEVGDITDQDINFRDENNALQSTGMNVKIENMHEMQNIDALQSTGVKVKIENENLYEMQNIHDETENTDDELRNTPVTENYKSESTEDDNWWSINKKENIDDDQLGTIDEIENEDDQIDLEKRREQNIRRNKKLFEELFKNDIEMNDFQKCDEPVKRKQKHQIKHRKTSPQPVEIRRSARTRGESVKYNEYELDQLLDDDYRIKSSRKKSYSREYSKKENFKWRISARRTPVPVLPVSDVSSEHIENISDRAIDKVYSKFGSSCHQCRQKTLDTKTYCRSGKCTGVRGQFCGPCLDGRYGEKVAEALYDPIWACPPCRGICNCSICLSRQGYAPTGILRPYALEKGYKSVKHYLEAVQKEIEDESKDTKVSADIAINKRLNKRLNKGFDVEDFLEDIPTNFYGF